MTIVKGKQPKKEYPLKGRSIIVGRSTEDQTWIPDIDLRPDEYVSKKHARLERKGNGWYVKDMGSANKTLVGDKEIGELDEPTPVLPDVPIVMGETILMIDPIKRHRTAWQDLTLGFDFPPVINYALYHCGIPTLSNLRVKNIGATRATPFSLSFSIPEYSSPFITTIPSINPGDIFSVDSIPVRLLHERLEELPERVKARLEVKADNELILEKEMWVLGFYEWSHEPEFQKTLACFVQPGNPVVQRITADAESYIENIAGIPSFSELQDQQHQHPVNCILNALYNCLSHKYQLKYVDPPISQELKSQVIRPPHKVIPDNQKRKGRGTCVDLTLLMVSCLESLKLNPLIIVVKESGWRQHAFAGCWSTTAHMVETILDYARIHDAVKNKEISLIECTGFSAREGKKLTYDKAVRWAEKQITPDRFLYALNISALRNVPAGRITPIRYTSSPEVFRILRKTQSFARRQKSRQINTAHLLYGLLTGGGEITRQVFKSADIDVDKAKKTIAEKTRGSFDGIPEESRNYRRALFDSKHVASRSGSPAEEEYHLLYSLLNLNSTHLKVMLESLNTDVEELKEILGQVLRGPGITIKELDGSFGENQVLK